MKNTIILETIRSAPISAKIGMFIVLLNIVVAFGAPLLAPYSETEVVDAALEGFNRHSLLGTDYLGRDLLTRLIYGARNTIFLAILTTAIAFIAGIVFGFLAAVMGGWVNQLLSRSVDVLMAFPTLIFALLVLSVLGTSVPALIAVIAVPTSTRVYRLSRALAMNVNVMDFVEVARIRGEGILWVMAREILPNTLGPLSAEFGLRFCFVFLFISALSFLGLGLQPPASDWGSMVRENASAISFGIYTPLFPAAAIGQLTISINLVVDWFLQRSSVRVPEEL
jgi:peptide/nickel transport system permease protein